METEKTAVRIPAWPSPEGLRLAWLGYSGRETPIDPNTDQLAMVHLIGVALKIDFALRDARGIHADIVSRMRSELELSANRGAERERHAFYCGYARGSGEGKILLGEVVDRLETAWAKFSTEVRP